MFTRIYALAVCFVSIICVAVSTGIGLYDIVEISFPELTMDSNRYLYLQPGYQRAYMYSNPVLINESGANVAMGTLDRSHAAPQPPTEEQQKQQREQQFAAAIDHTQHDAQRSLLQILIILLVSTPLFFIHWRYAQKLDIQNRPE
jgi:hypothetical protein